MSIGEELKSCKVSVIVPVFNEAKNLVSHLNLLISEVEPAFRNVEIIVVSDGSTDQTNDLLKEHFSNRLRLVLLEKNQGKGYAVRKGFFEAEGDYILFIDGGMELHPKEIRTFIGLLVLYEADIVLGSKRHPQSQIDYPLIRRFLSGCYQFLVKWFFDLDVTDTQVGLKLFRREVVEAIREDLEIDRYGFDLEILALAKFRGHGKMLEAPVQLDYFNRNRQGPREWFHVLKMCWVIARDTFRVYRKIRRIHRLESREASPDGNVKTGNAKKAN